MARTETKHHQGEGDWSGQPGSNRTRKDPSKKYPEISGLKMSRDDNPGGIEGLSIEIQTYQSFWYCCKITKLAKRMQGLSFDSYHKYLADGKHRNIINAFL